MITDCFGAKEWDISDFEAVFLEAGFSFLKIIIPGAICLVMWRIFITNRRESRAGILTLGLDETSAADPRARYLPAMSPYVLLLYVTTTVVTFNVGLLFFSAWESLRTILRSLLE
jgi:hypothetical protein